MVDEFETNPEVPNIPDTEDALVTPNYHPFTRIIHEWECEENVRAVDFCDDGSKVVIGCSGDLTSNNDVGNVSLYNVESGERVWSKDCESRVEVVSYCSANNYVAVGCMNGYVSVYGIDSKELHKINIGEYDGDYVSAVCFSSDGSILAAGGHHTKCIIYDTTTWEQIHWSFPCDKYISSISMSIDTKIKMIALGGGEQIEIYDLANGNELKKIECGRTHPN